MTATKPLGTYGNAVGTVTPYDHKMAQVALFVKTTTANLIRPGVLYNGVSNIVTGLGTMSYAVGPFSAVLTRGATAGAVILTNDGTVNVATTAAPGSNSRIDIVYVWAREFSLDGTNSDPVIGVVQGTAAASPTAPSLAGFPGALELARITVPAGVTATNSGTTITQTAPFTSTDGGVVRFRSTAEMNLWTTALPEQEASVIGTEDVYKSRGGSWFLVGEDYLSNVAASSYSMGANSTMYILRGSGSTVPVFGVPMSNRPLTLSTDVYSNDVFEWNRSTGELRVLKSGTYEIEVRATTGTQGSGTVTLGITKNSTTVGTTANDLARDDRSNSAAVTQSPFARIPAVALTSSDVIRFIAFLFGAGGAVTIGGTAPYTANFRIRRLGN